MDHQACIVVITQCLPVPVDIIYADQCKSQVKLQKAILCLYNLLFAVTCGCYPAGVQEGSAAHGSCSHQGDPTWATHVTSQISPAFRDRGCTTRKFKSNGAGDMGAVVDSRGTTRTWSCDWLIQRVCNLDTETPVRHTESSKMWPGQMHRISPTMGRDRITCLPLRKEKPDHKAHCWRVPTHCIPWRPATSTPSGSLCSGMVVETVNETVRVFQTNNNNIYYVDPGLQNKHWPAGYL